MRRSEREITSRAEIDAILLREKVLRLALAVGNEPYVVPLSYGYDCENGALCVHTAVSGRKLQFVAQNPRVCFEVEGPVSLLPAGKACAWGVSYESVIGYGTLTEILDADEKARALRCLMRHQTGSTAVSGFAAEDLVATRVWWLAIESVEGKRAA
jgi:nitroimidazol reductase NimA-like FMN-containing flavoprotein (pyridoxamine 5'-phosphate oxidase superfamily)